MKLKAGIIGMGKMGVLRTDILKKMSGIELIGYFDTVQKKSVNLPYYSDIDNLLNKLDLVVISVPHKFTANIAIKAINDGVHTALEKPPGISFQEAYQIYQADVKNPKVECQVLFNHRYHEPIQKIKSIADSDELGKIIWIRGVYGRRDPGAIWRSDKNIAGGGILLSQGLHLLDIFRYLLGEFSEVKSFISKGYWNSDIEDNVFAILRNTNNQMVSLHSSSTLWKHEFKLDIGLEHGYLSLNGILTESRSFGNEKLTIGRKDGETRGMPDEQINYFTQDKSWKHEINDFVWRVRGNNVENINSTYSAYKTMELLERVYKDDS